MPDMMEGRFSLSLSLSFNSIAREMAKSQLNAKAML